MRTSRHEASPASTAPPSRVALIHASPSPRSLEPLSDQELGALIDAAAWYAKYHHQMITDQADDPSAMAAARRQRFKDLHEALGKLGVPIRRPEALAS